MTFAAFAAEFLWALLRESQMSQPHAVTTPMIRILKLSGEVLCSFDKKLGRPSQGNLLNLERGGTLVKSLCELRLDMGVQNPDNLPMGYRSCPNSRCHSSLLQNLGCFVLYMG